MTTPRQYEALMNRDLEYVDTYGKKRVRITRVGRKSITINQNVIYRTKKEPKKTFSRTVGINIPISQSPKFKIL